MRALLVLFCLVLPVLARGGKRDDPIFELPEGKKAPEKAEKEQIREDLAKDIERLAGWPGERSRRAAERLIVQKEHSLPVIRKILVSTADSDENYKPGAGYVLGRIGEASDFLTLVLVASEKRQHKHAATLLEAAWRLNPDQAVAEAFRFFHLSATTLRREATKFVRARITKKNLTAVVELLDKRTAERPFTREIGLILLDRLVETREITWSEAGPRIYRALGDESPQVASRAMRLVASHNEAANIKELNQLITKEYSYWRQRSYAALGLALLSSAFKVQPFTPETIESLKGERGLEHPRELLAQASAALALAQAGLRTGDRELVRLLDSKIPIVLIESVGASRRHYRDFASVMPLSYAMLRRITGQNFPDQAPVWAQWWRDHGRRFRARRELIEVDEDDLEAAVLEVTWPQSTPRKRSVRLQMVGIQQPSYLHGRAYAVPKEEIARLTGLLRESGFFQAMEVDPARLDREEAMVVLRVGDLVRTVAYGKGEGLTQVRDRILNAVDATTKEYSWQLWWSIREQPSWQLFFGENRRWFKDHPGAEERAARMRSMVAGAVGGMTMVDDRLFAVRFLRDLPGGGGALTEDEVAKLVAAVAGEREANRFVAEVLELLVPEAGPKAASGLVDALAAKVGPRSQDLLVELCSSIPFEKVAALASDSRWKVRRSAVAALAKKDAERARPVLEQRLEDEEVFVRVVAAEALARVQDPATLPALAILSKDDSENVRASAAYAYGLMGSAASRKAIRPLLYNDTYPDVRVRAIEGLAESRDPAAVDLLIGVFERETDVRVRAAAASGVVAMETPALVRKLLLRLEHTVAASPERVALVNVLARFRSDEPLALLRAVLRGDDVVSADAAALGLARRWEASAMVQLIQMTEAGRSARSAVRGLQVLTSQEFEAESYDRQAGNYKAWYQTHSTGNPRSWFSDALTERGYDTSAMSDLAATEETQVEDIRDDTVELLLTALRDKAWFIRRNASHLLNRRMGEGAPDEINYLTRPTEMEETIRSYHDWWAKVVAERERERRG